ncbi:adhesive domain-containing protein, partial [Exiguobacterium artemiae]|uniref:adhesive domain-containing protein n=1 Tax=Exiguobacterium artemiae TaxID=340145 RepID=UPI0029644838
MNKKTPDFRKKMNRHHRNHTKRLVKLLAASSLALSPISFTYTKTEASEKKFQPQQQQFANSIKNSIGQAPNRVSLAEVQLLTNVIVDANLTEQPGNYDLALNLTGTGLVDAEIVNPDRVAVFNIPELAGKMSANGDATVSVELLPITLEDLPTLKGQLDPVAGALNTTVGNLLSIVNTVAAGSVTGIDELEQSLDALNNLDDALSDLLDYEGQVPIVINPDGSIVIDFSDGLGNHLDTAVKEVVQETLQNVIDAINGVRVNGVAGLVVNPVLNVVKRSLTPLNTLLTAVTNDTVALSNELAGVQVLGPTTINANVTVDKPAGVNDEVIVTGSVVNTSVIDADLLADLDGQDTIVFDEEADADADADADSDADA